MTTHAQPSTALARFVLPDEVDALLVCLFEEGTGLPLVVDLGLSVLGELDQLHLVQEAGFLGAGSYSLV